MNAFPLFYHNGTLEAGQVLDLEAETARHIVLALRMGPNDPLELTNGRGDAALAAILDTGKKKCRVKLESVTHHSPATPALHLAIAFTRHSGRNEWLLEKATELGVCRIIPLLTARSGKERFRPDRWHNILVAAMIQSQQYRLPLLEAPMDLSQLPAATGSLQVLMAHCMPQEPRLPLSRALIPGRDTCLCIGPEGDFTEEEVTSACANGAIAISLGQTRLRTETAAMAACAFFHFINEKQP